MNQEETTTTTLTATELAELKRKVEATLFLIDKPLSAGNISLKVNADINDVRQVLGQIVQDYESRDTAVRINCEDGYIMTVHEEYEDLVQDFLELEIKVGCLRTLSAIALKEPVNQTAVVDMRGGGAYEHIKDLVEMNLVVKKREGPRFILRTSPLFARYFKLTDQGLELQDILKKNSKKARFVRDASMPLFVSDNTEAPVETEAKLEEAAVTEEVVTETAVAETVETTQELASAERDDSETVQEETENETSSEDSQSQACEMPRTGVY